MRIEAVRTPQAGPPPPANVAGAGFTAQTLDPTGPLAKALAQYQQGQQIVDQLDLGAKAAAKLGDSIKLAADRARLEVLKFDAIAAAMSGDAKRAKAIIKELAGIAKELHGMADGSGSAAADGSSTTVTTSVTATATVITASVAGATATGGDSASTAVAGQGGSGQPVSGEIDSVQIEAIQIEAVQTETVQSGSDQTNNGQDSSSQGNSGTTASSALGTADPFQQDVADALVLVRKIVDFLHRAFAGRHSAQDMARLVAELNDSPASTQSLSAAPAAAPSSPAPSASVNITA